MVLSGEGGVGACGIDRIDPVQMDIDTKRKKKKDSEGNEVRKRRKRVFLSMAFDGT